MGGVHYLKMIQLMANGNSAAGFIIRISNTLNQLQQVLLVWGIIMFSRLKQINALKHTLNWTTRLRLSKIQVEGDSKILIQIITKRANLPWECDVHSGSYLATHGEVLSNISYSRLQEKPILLRIFQQCRS